MKGLILATAVLVGTFSPIAIECLASPIGTLTPSLEGPATPGIERMIAEAITSLGNLGFMAWLCYYMVAKALPAKDAQSVRQQQEFVAETKLERESRAAESKLERDAHRETVERLVRQSEAQTNALLEVVRHCPGPTAK
jgi:heme exporter protein D